MKSKFVLSVLAVIGIFALPATSAQAGSGGSPFAINSFFVCQGIQSAAPTTPDVDVVDSRLGTDPQRVKIGNAILSCVVAKLFPAGSDHAVPANEILPHPPADNSTNRDGLKCYNVSVARKDSPAAAKYYGFADYFYPEPTPDVVRTSSFQYICAPARLSIP